MIEPWGTPEIKGAEDEVKGYLNLSSQKLW